ncbi:hypothetical protein [Streptomyces sp. SPB074]|uniref:hypothetical protein n=1 Tax=Streptomyces sp. (strain SPB074) TaxID=465543 RepID=UPI00056BAE69|nr:hypothetical protein [Streptomyces sp. SPB074]
MSSAPRHVRGPSTVPPAAERPEEGTQAGELPLADEVPFPVGPSGTGFLTDGRSRLVLGGGLMCLGCGLATALLAFRLRRA